MKRRKVQNGPLKSLMRDKSVVEAIKNDLETIKQETRQLVGAGVGAESLLGENESVLESLQLETVLEKPVDQLDQFGLLEAIILSTGRPPLLIKDGIWEKPRNPEIADRLEKARTCLENAIPKVGRVELLNSHLSYVGTGWMIDEDIMITNRHVAATFAMKDGETIVMRRNPFGMELEVQVDFNEEFESPNPPFVVDMEEVLHIEDDRPGNPDLALIRVKRVPDLPEPIELSPLAVRFDDEVAVIGYPARDSSRNDPFLMAELFNNIYEVKRLSPGRISGVRSDRLIMTHDCTTLGGNSGSVVVNLEDGKAAGLHFAGIFEEDNFAVTSEILREKMAGLGRRLIVSMPELEEAAEAPDRKELESRTGYDEDFLGQASVPLPQAAKGVLSPVNGREDHLLHYLHFSVAMHLERKLAMFTACNIDGNSLFGIRRGRDRWEKDPRMDKDLQIGNELYRHNPLDRGHLVRRLDPAWGDTREEAIQAADDTFFYTNATPQHSRLNQREWLRLEEFILDNAATHDLKVTVFTGPVFSDRDREYRGVRLPEEYWKVVVVINAFGGDLSATGYLLSQSEFVEDLEFVFGEFKTYQVPIKTIEEKTGLFFGELTTHDPLRMIESIGPRQISGAGDLLL